MKKNHFKRIKSLGVDDLAKELSKASCVHCDFYRKDSEQCGNTTKESCFEGIKRYLLKQSDS